MSSRRSLPLLVTTLVVLAARGAVVSALGDHPLLQPGDGLDTGAYVDLARRVAAGDVLLRVLPEPFFVSPLYVWFLGAVLAVTGGSLKAALALHAVLGALAAWLAGDAARRLYGDRAAVPAAALLGLTGVVAFHEAVLLQAALDPFLAALTLGLLVRALEGEPRPRPFLLVGLSLGVFAMNRPNVLPWAAVALALVHPVGRFIAPVPGKTQEAEAKAVKNAQDANIPFQAFSAFHGEHKGDLVLLFGFEDIICG